MFDDDQVRRNRMNRLNDLVELRMIAMESARRAWDDGKPERERQAALRVMRPWIEKHRTEGIAGDVEMTQAEHIRESTIA